MSKATKLLDQAYYYMNSTAKVELLDIIERYDRAMEIVNSPVYSNASALEVIRILRGEN